MWISPDAIPIVSGPFPASHPFTPTGISRHRHASALFRRLAAQSPQRVRLTLPEGPFRLDFPNFGGIAASRFFDLHAIMGCFHFSGQPELQKARDR
jgi:hypothetical protein